MTEYKLVTTETSNYEGGRLNIPDEAIEVNVEYGWEMTGLGERFRCARVDYLLPVDTE